MTDVGLLTVAAYAGVGLGLLAEGGALYAQLSGAFRLYGTARGNLIHEILGGLSAARFLAASL